MSEGNRFWVGRTGRTVANYAVHRERGDIPGCVPAVDVFIEREVSQVQWYNQSNTRIAAYTAALQDKSAPWPQPLEFFKNRAPKSAGNIYSS
jgi:hypothetical protein